jgi:hypothetical protein
MNQILKRLDLLESRLSDTRIVLGPMAMDIHTLVALGSGFEDTGGIWLDGSPLFDKGLTRGVHLVVFNSQLSFKFKGSYDTFASDADYKESKRLALDVASHTRPNDVVAVATSDAYVEYLEWKGRAALASIGGSALVEDKFKRSRANGAFLGIVPTNRPSANFNYLVSVMPADKLEFGEARTSALPFAWGVYSIPMLRFLLGGSTGFSNPTQMSTPPILSDPVTVLPGISRTEVDALGRAGITTMEKLAKANEADIVRMSGWSSDAAKLFIADAKRLLGQ